MIQKSELTDIHQKTKPTSSHKSETAGYYIGARYHEKAFATIFSVVQFLLLNRALSEQGAKGKSLLLTGWREALDLPMDGQTCGYYKICLLKSNHDHPSGALTRQLPSRCDLHRAENGKIQEFHGREIRCRLSWSRINQCNLKDKLRLTERSHFFLAQLDREHWVRPTLEEKEDHPYTEDARWAPTWA